MRHRRLRGPWRLVPLCAAARHSSSVPVTASASTFTADSTYALAVQARVRDARDRISAARERGGHAQHVTLVAVTKTHGIEAVRAVAAAGVTDVGENRVQEAEPKRADCGVPLRWHLIGHVQRNKAASAVTFDLVHSLDSDRLATALDRAAAESGKVCEVLVQVNVSGEESKYGLAAADVGTLAERLHACSSLKVRGIMTMAPFDAEEAVLRKVFADARACAQTLSAAGHDASVLSMGMSGDFEIAVEEGATHVRLGTMLFGERAG